MNQHVTILGVLYVAFGVLGLLSALAVLVFFGGVAGLVGVAATSEPDAAIAAPILGVIAIVVFTVLVVLSLPGLVVGVGLLKLQPWARVGAIILSALNLLNVPIGTLLGAYGLWVLLSAEGEAAFR